MFAICKVKLFCWCRIPVTHLRTTSPFENTTQLLRCGKTGAYLLLVQSWSSKQLPLANRCFLDHRSACVGKQPQNKAAQQDARDFSFKGKTPQWPPGINNFYFHAHQLVQNRAPFLKIWCGRTWQSFILSFSLIGCIVFALNL